MSARLYACVYIIYLVLIGVLSEVHALYKFIEPIFVAFCDTRFRVTSLGEDGRVSFQEDTGVVHLSLAKDEVRRTSYVYFISWTVSACTV